MEFFTEEFIRAIPTCSKFLFFMYSNSAGEFLLSVVKEIFTVSNKGTNMIWSICSKPF